RGQVAFVWMPLSQGTSLPSGHSSVLRCATTGPRAAPYPVAASSLATVLQKSAIREDKDASATGIADVGAGRRGCCRAAVAHRASGRTRRGQDRDAADDQRRPDPDRRAQGLLP